MTTTKELITIITSPDGTRGEFVIKLRNSESQPVLQIRTKQSYPIPQINVPFITNSLYAGCIKLQGYFIHNQNG